MSTRQTEVDVVTFEVLRHRLWELNDEMALMVGRISGAPSVYESGDFNVAILTPDGQGLYTGVFVVRQASALDIVVQKVIEMFGDNINDGDAFMTSDPWFGALHAMDAAVVMPVFHEGERIAWTGVVVHELDMGGEGRLAEQGAERGLLGRAGAVVESEIGAIRRKLAHHGKDRGDADAAGDEQVAGRFA